MLLDSTFNIELNDEQLKKYSNEVNALRRLLLGLTFLYQQVKQAEIKINEYNNLKDNSRSFIWGNAPVYGKVQIDHFLISNYFDWYSITAVKAFSIIGYIGSLIKHPVFDKNINEYKETV